MSSAGYRPSGPLSWVIQQLSDRKSWDVLGALAAEDRANTVALEMKRLNSLRECTLLKIADEPSRFHDATKLACNRHLSELRTQLDNHPNIHDLSLFSGVDELAELSEHLVDSLADNVVFDISAIPKRVFFFLLRQLLQSETVKNLLVTYTIPERYGEGKLHENPGSWDPLPSFGATGTHGTTPMLVIAVGYDHLNLLEVIQERSPSPVLLLMPFPSKPPGSIRNWEFVRFVAGQVRFGPQDIIRVHTHGTSLAFDHLVSQCRVHSEEVILAPFGPKPLSLAMALFAISREATGKPVTVGYTQPKAYSDKYSVSVEIGHDGMPVVHTYCIKLQGRNLYSMED